MKEALRRQPGGPVLRVGHRGAKGYAPENTMASFQEAPKRGVTFAETDVHLSADGIPVLIHDDHLDRTTNGHGLVREKTLTELKQLDAGSWFDARFAGEQIPTLDELLAWASGTIRLAIEIKNGPYRYAGIAEQVIRLVRRYDMVEQVILISFDHFVVREAKMIEPRVATGILYVGGLIDAVAAARAAAADAIHPNWAYITPALVETAHDAGLAVSAWNPNDLPTMQRLSAMGVDSIGTDFPDLLGQI